MINLDDAEVPQSPIKLDIKPAADLSKIALIDFEPEAFVDCPNDFIVDVSGQFSYYHLSFIRQFQFLVKFCLI